MQRQFVLYLALLFTGVSWGLTTPLTVLAVSTGHQPLGLIFWQLAVIIVMSLTQIVLSGSALPFSRRYLSLLLGVFLLGTLIPDFLLYRAAAHLSGGVLSIAVSMVPFFSLPMAIYLGFEKPSAIRFLGALCGGTAIVVLIGPDAALPQDTDTVFIFVALGATVLYAAQGNFIAWHGTRGLNPIQILLGSSVLGIVFVAPPAVATGQFVNLIKPWDIADWAVLGTAVFHGLAYGGFFFLISKAGPVFTSQVAYLVTASGVLWSMLLLSESYSGWIWGSFALLMLGILLVRPRALEDHDAKADA